MSDISGSFSGDDLDGFRYSFKDDDPQLKEGKVRVTFRSPEGTQRTFTMTCLKLKDLSEDSDPVKINEVVSRILKDSAPILAASLNPQKLKLDKVEASRVKKIDFTLTNQGLKNLKYTTPSVSIADEEKQLKDYAKKLESDKTFISTAQKLYEFLHKPLVTRENPGKLKKPIKNPKEEGRSSTGSKGIGVRERSEERRFEHLRGINGAASEGDEDDDDSASVYSDVSSMGSVASDGTEVSRAGEKPPSLFSRFLGFIGTSRSEDEFAFGLKGSGSIRHSRSEASNVSFEREPSAPRQSQYLFQDNYSRYNERVKIDVYKPVFESIDNDTDLSDAEKDYKKLALLDFIFITEKEFEGCSDRLFESILPDTFDVSNNFEAIEGELNGIEKGLDRLLNDKTFTEVAKKRKLEDSKETTIDPNKKSTELKGKFQLFKDAIKFIKSFKPLNPSNTAQEETLADRYQEHFKSKGEKFTEEDIKAFFKAYLKNISDSNLIQAERFLMYFERGMSSAFNIEDFVALFPKKTRDSLNDNNAFQNFQHQVFSSRLPGFTKNITQFLDDQSGKQYVDTVANILKSEKPKSYELWIVLEEKLAKVNKHPYSRISWSAEEKGLFPKAVNFKLLSDFVTDYATNRILKRGSQGDE